jgi:hypothetical protein
MSIEYLPGAEIGAKINVDTWKKPEKFKKELEPNAYLPGLREALSKMAAETNRNFRGFLDTDNRIIIRGKDAWDDKTLALAQEQAFCREINKSKETWQHDVEKNPANLTEVALTVLLYKFLKKDFIVARSSSYDDYNNGIDQVLVYKPTGEVVCGFDEVIGNHGDDGGTKKSAKLEKIMSKGGATVKYGATMLDGKLVRDEVKNVPAFYMALSKEELNELLESIKNNAIDINEIDKKIFTKLISSLAEQSASLSSTADPELQMKAKLALARMKAVLD